MRDDQMIQFVIFGAIAMLRTILYYTWLAQFLEYRWDKCMDCFKNHTSKMIPQFMIVRIVFFISSVCLWLIGFSIDQVLLCIYFGLVVETVEGIYMASKHLIRRPIWTGKTVLVFALTVLLITVIQFMFMYRDGARALVFVLSLLFAGDLTAFVVVCIEPIARFFKSRVIKKAKAKMLRLKSVKVIGITGSYGKSGTKEFLYQILSSKYKVWKTSGNTNVDIGIARAVLNELDDSHDFAIVEMGAYRTGEIASICDIVNPNFAILTAISDQHLSLFGTIENITNAKCELLQSLKDDGHAFLNADSEGVRDVIKNRIKQFNISTTTYSINGTANMMALKIKVEPNRLEFYIHNTKFEVELCGRQHLSNLLAAIACALHCGMSLHETAASASAIQPTENMMRLRKTVHPNIQVIDDSYNANFVGVKAALDQLNLFVGKKIMIFPGMYELGSLSDERHVAIAHEIEKVCDYVLITSSDFVAPLKSGFSEDYFMKSVKVLTGEQVMSSILDFVGDETATVLFENRGAKVALTKLCSC